MGDLAYVLNGLWLLLCGVLVMWMAAGFVLLESGLTRRRNTASILLKNVGRYALACLCYDLVGYDLMYGQGGGWFSGWSMLSVSAPETHPQLAGFFFQVVFVATAASVISGVVAGRMRLGAFFAFVIVLAAVIYPIQGHWSWGGSQLGGLLDGFTDFAGSTIVHSVGGWAALAGLLLLGPRRGRYLAGGRVVPMPGSNLPLATVCLTRWVYGKIDLSLVLNGALSGLVAITRRPGLPSVGLACFIGAVGGVLVTFAVPFFDRLHLDDPVGALSVHLVNGIWGTLAVGMFHPEVTLGAQAIGILVIGAWTFGISLGLWWLIAKALGLRVDPQQEEAGLYPTELGMEAYPEFG